MKARSEQTLSISAAHPFMDAVLAKGVKREQVAEQLDANVEDLTDHTLRLPANTLYRFCRWSAETLGDPFLAAHLGRRMANGGWAPALALLQDSKTVIAFLTSMSVLGESHAGPLSYRLEMQGVTALWRLVRVNIGAYEAEHADAAAVAFFTEILRRAAGSEWSDSKVTVVTTDVSLIPREILSSKSVIKGSAGIALRFPSEWLAYPLPVTRPPAGLRAIKLEPGAADTVASVRDLIERHISDQGLTIDRVIALTGMSRWQIQSSLGDAGTNFAAVKTELRIKLAKQALKSSEANISEVAASLGYSSVSNFSRAFRDWTGVSPKEFRNRS